MKAKKLIQIMAILLFGYNGFAQEVFTIKGYVKSAEHGKELISADIYSPELTTGTITNSDGFYSLILPEGNYTLKISCMEFISKNIPIHLNENKELNIELSSSSTEKEETINLSKDVDKNNKTKRSVVKLFAKKTKQIPSIFNEQFIRKTLHPIPMVTNGLGSSSFPVRPENTAPLFKDEVQAYHAAYLK